MCKAYGFEPTINVLRGFLSLGPGGDWLTLSKRSEVDVPDLFIIPLTNIRSPSEPVIMHYGKSMYFSYFITNYNLSVDIYLSLFVLMAFLNFVVDGNDKDMSFFTKNPNEGGFRVGSPSVFMNNNDVDAIPTQPVAFAQPSQLVENTADSDDSKTRDR
ncbi:hypothetical protein Tco_1293483 [Tanacetum coccineum]